MAAPLVERFANDIVPASDHNDVKSYIEDGSYRINTEYTLLTETTAPSAAKGIIYFDDAADLFYQCKDGTDFVKLNSYDVSAHTSNYSLSAHECDGYIIYTNDGASDTVEFELPVAAAKYRVTFIVAENKALAIVAQSGETIYTSEETGGVGAVSNSTKGNSITLIAVSTGKWMTQSDRGQWAEYT